MLRLSIQRLIGIAAQNIGNWFNNEKLVIWGITRTPFTFEVEDDDFDPEQV